MRLRRLHRFSATLIAAFILIHLANHIALFSGAQAHISFMETIRPVYRSLPVEIVLLGAIGFQIITGATLFWRGRAGRSHLVAKLQAASGVFLLLFLFIHISAVLTGRASGVDTNIYFAVAGYYNGLSWFFVPYYFLAVASFFAHLGCAIYWISGAGRAGRVCLMLMLGGGIILAAALVTAMAGWITPVAVPASYLS